jgi:DNA-binding transcriptional LysR family regulator
LPEEYVDVALRIGVLPDSRLMALRLGTILFVVCASPAYLALRGSPATPDELASHDCIIHEGFQVWTFASGQSDIAITVRPRLVVSNAGAACDAAVAGIGLTRTLSYQVGPSIEAGTLTTVLDEYQPASLPVSFVYRAGRYRPIKLRAFLDFASPRLRARLVR